MKKYIPTVLTGCALIASLASCSEDHEPVEYTYYADITMLGEPYIIHNAGEPYTDAGATAVMEGVDVTGQIDVSTGLDFSDPQPGYYTIDYSVVNKDGFAMTKSRVVLVSDPDDAATGIYEVSKSSSRTSKNGTELFDSPFEIMIFGSGPKGTYEVSDLLGGWYAQRAGYGSSYEMWGVVSVGSDGALTLDDSYIAGWGDGLDSLTGKYDAATGTFTWTCGYAQSMTFDISARRTRDIELDDL